MIHLDSKRRKIAGLPHEGEGDEDMRNEDIPADADMSSEDIPAGDEYMPNEDIPPGDEDVPNEDIPAGNEGMSDEDIPAGVKVPDVTPFGSDDEECLSGEQLSKYHRQIAERGVFGAIDPVNGSVMGGLLVTASVEDGVFNYYCPYAELALNYYNIKNKKKFNLKDLVRANTVIGGMAGVFYLTFQATDQNAADDSTATERFQAHLVADRFGLVSGSRQPEILIVFCRLEPATGQGDCPGFTGSCPETESDGTVDITKSKPAKRDNSELFDDTLLAKFAVEFYNVNNGCKFEFNHIESVKKKCADYDELELTFQAKDMKAADPESETKTFEAKVSVDYLGLFPREGWSGYYHSRFVPNVLFKSFDLKSTLKQGDSSDVSPGSVSKGNLEDKSSPQFPMLDATWRTCQRNFFVRRHEMVLIFL